MDFKSSVKKAIDIVKLDEKAISEISKDKEAWKIGILIIAIGGVLSGLISYILTNTASSALNMMGLGMLGNMVKTASIGMIISAPVGAIIGTFISVGILFIIAKLFKGKSTYMELLGPIAFASVLSWLAVLNIIPILGGLVNFAAGIWGIVVTVIIIRNVNAFTTGKAVMVVLIPVIIIVLLAVIIAVIAAVLFGAGIMGAIGAIPGLA